MVSIPAGKPASDKQISLLFELATERVIPPDAKYRLVNKLAKHQDRTDRYQMTMSDAREAIGWLFRQSVRPGVVPSHIQAMPTNERKRHTAEIGPRPGSEANYARAAGAQLRQDRNLNSASRAVKRDPETLLTSGVFRLNSEIYIIVPTRSGKHVAKRLVNTPKRLTSSGEIVEFDYVMAPGVIWALEEEHRLPVADIQSMLIQYKMCIYPGCYRRLRAAKSVAAGVGKRHAERLGIPWGKKET